MPTKAIISNKTALSAKYSDATEAIISSLAKLIETDQQQGLNTQVIYLDNPDQAKKLNFSVVTDPQNEKQNKEAIDGAYRTLAPDYLVILGAPDIIPYQSLDSLDPYDKTIPSDLPYASGSSYSTQAKDFINPHRIVSRMPDVLGDKDPNGLIQMINNSANLKAKKRSVYLNYFAISTDQWKESTGLSLQNIFGNTDNLNLSPPGTCNWPSQKLKANTHFYNLHGAANYPFWLGQKNTEFPMAIDSEELVKQLAEDNIVVSEACYGGLLYNPSQGRGHMADEMALCNTYLLNSCCAFCGSTTTSYGPSKGNDHADLITQYFLINLLDGSGIGEAMLRARQKYIQQCGAMDNIDLKTIAQFHCYGDAAAYPIETPLPDKESIPHPDIKDHLMTTRKEGHLKLKTTGELLKDIIGVYQAKKISPSAKAQQKISDLIAHYGLKNIQSHSGSFEGGRVFTRQSNYGKNHKVHHIHGEIDSSHPVVKPKMVIIAHEENEEIIRLKIAYSK